MTINVHFLSYLPQFKTYFMRNIFFFRKSWRLWDEVQKKSRGGTITCHKGTEGEGEQRYSSTLSLISVVDGNGWSTPRPDRCTPRKEAWYPLYRRLGGSQSRYERAQKISPPTGNRSPDCPVRSQSPHRLSYPGPYNNNNNNMQVRKEAVWGQRTDRRRKPTKRSETVPSFKQGSCRQYKPGSLV